MNAKTRIVHAVKEYGSWYIDDDNGYSHADNQLIAGIPEIIEALVGLSATRVRMEYSTEARKECVHLRLVSTDPSGSVYTARIGSREMQGWLCPVFFHYFKEAPKEFYVSFSEVK